MHTPYILHESSMKLTLPSHRPAAKLSEMLSVWSISRGPFTQPNKVLSIDDAALRTSDRGPQAMDHGQLARFIELSLYRPGRGRPYPAAGGIYSVHVYVVTYAVEGLECGVHYLRHNTRNLEYLGRGAASQEFRRSGFIQDGGEKLPSILLLCADTTLSRRKYHDRALRMSHIEAGCLMQNMYLAAARLKLSICALGAVSDRGALRLCGIAPDRDANFVCGLSLGELGTSADPGQASVDSSTFGPARAK